MHPWTLIAALYSLPLLRNIFFFLSDRRLRLTTLNPCFGYLEYHFGFFRDLGVIAFFAFRFWKNPLLLQEMWEWIPILPVVGMIFYNRWWRWSALKPLLPFLHAFPDMHPDEFFHHLYAQFGFLPHEIVDEPKRKINLNHIDFRSSQTESKKSFWILLRAAKLTAFIARLSYRAFRWMPAEKRGSIVSALCLLWAARIAQWARAEVIVENRPSFSHLDLGKQIVALNHKSFFDFAFSPFFLFRRNPDGSAMDCMPRYLVAKDHFKDSWLLGGVLGFKKIFSAWGMIFVDRNKKKGSKTREVIRDSVLQLLKSERPLAIYPQGSRTHGQFLADGSRWDAGYFCVGKQERLRRERGHLKKGVVFLALETANSLKQDGIDRSVWIVPVGIDGAGTTCPRNSLRVQTNVTVRFRTAPALLVEACNEKQYSEKAEHLLKTLDESFQKMLNISTRLERRFLVELRSINHAHHWEDVAASLKAWRGKDDLLYSILDFLYACPPKHHRFFVNELSQCLTQNAPREHFLDLRNRIVDRL